MPHIRCRLLVASLGIVLPVAAHSLEALPSLALDSSMFDTEHMFGFAEGSDINEAGEWEVESITVAGFGALGSRFNADNATSLKYTVTDDLRFSVGTLAEYHTFRFAPDFNGRSGMQFSGMFVDARWKIVDRLVSPFGMTLSVASEWRRIDSGTGRNSEGYGASAALLIDKEIVPQRFFTVLNLIYAPSVLRQAGGWGHEDGFAVIAGGSYAISPNIIFGGEIRHENLGYNGFLTAHALFIGPQLYIRPTEHASVKIAYARQIPDFAARNIDVTNFESNQVELQVVTHF